MRITLKLCLIMACLILSAGMLRAEKLDRIVAVVNGDIILFSELQDYVRNLEKSSPEAKTDDPARKAQIERDVLQQMVRDRLAEQEVKRLKISVKKGEVDEAIESIKQDNHLTDAQLDAVIKQNAQTRDQFREGIRKELEKSRLLERVLKSKTVITKEQVDAFLKTGKADLSESKERRRLAIIFLPFSQGGSGKPEDVEKQAREIHSRLKGGADFGKLAREYSKGPAVEEGGDIGFVGSDEMAPYIESATRGLKGKDLTDPVKTSAGYYIIKVIDVTQEKQNQGDAALREKARRQLFQQELNRKFEEWVRDLEGRSFIQISL